MLNIVMAKRSRKESRDYVWTLFVALMFIGLGAGMLVGEAGAGVLLGMGFGFLAVALARILKK